MAEGDQPPLKRARPSREELDRMSREQLMDRFMEQEAYIDVVLSRPPEGGANVSELEEKIRQMQQESARRENVLVMRLTAKEQELQEFMSQNEELKRAQNPSTAQLRGMMLDPAINLMFQRMKKEMEQSKEKLEQAQNDLAAWKFTPDGQTGKRLMAKCRMLLQENAELGRVISAGRTAKLEGEIALGKKFVEEMKQSQAETDEFLVEMDEDVEGLQSTILLLQQQLREAKDQISDLQQKNELRTHCGRSIKSEPTNSLETPDDHMDSLAGEQRTSHFAGNGSSKYPTNSSHKGGREYSRSGGGSSSSGHSQHPAPGTTNGGGNGSSSHHTDMESDSYGEEQEQGERTEHMQNHEGCSRHSPASAGEQEEATARDRRHTSASPTNAEPMETDSGVVSEAAPRTGIKVKTVANDTLQQNGMAETENKG